MNNFKFTSTFFLVFFFIISKLNAQVTETFEGFSSGCSTSFVSGGVTFNGTKLKVWIPNQPSTCGTANLTGLGVGTSCSGDGCSAISNNFFDNGGNYGTGQTYIISTSGASGTAFALKSMYVYISTDGGTSATTGSVTFVGKKGGSTVFSFTKSSWPNTSNGFSFVNFATESGVNNSFAVIDAIEMSTAGSINYLAVDNFRWAPTTMWNGTVWNNGNPSSTIDAVIGSSTVPSASFTCKALVINNTFSLTTTGITATVNADITNNGNGIAGTGNVVIAANAALQGTSFSFSGNLTVNSGATLTTNDKLTLASDATNTGRVGNSAGIISGNVTVQRYIPSGRRVFRFLAHPFTTNMAMSSLTDNIDITGSGGTPFTTTVTNAPSAFGYSNATANSSLTSDPGWTNLTANSVFAPKMGYRILIRGTKSQTNSLNGGSYTPNAVTLDWTGTLNSGTQAFTLPYGGANQTYSLIGNPYACPVDVSLTTRGTSVNANFSIWNAQAGSRGAYVTQAFSSSYILPSGAAFFAQTSAGTNNTITFEEADKVTTTPTSIFRTISNEEKLVLELTNENNNYTDQLTFYFDDKNKNYTVNNDVLWDAEKLLNPDANLYSFSNDGKKLAIDRRPIEDSSIIPLGLTNTSNASFYLTVKEIPAVINNSYNLYLNDKWLNTQTLLQPNTSINIAISSNMQSQGNNRFEIVSKLKPVLQTAPNSFTISISPNPAANGKTTLSYKQAIAENTTIVITDAIGNKVQTINLGKVQNGVQSLNITKLPAGSYYVQVSNGLETKIEKLVIQ